jgi:SsrA-binding protein
MGIKQIARNKRAGYDFELKEKLEAGIALKGTEVKSLRAGKCTITESHITIDGNFEVWLHNMRIPHYEFGNIHNHEESRKRKLLVHKNEIKELYHEVKAGGLTLIPVQIYFKESKVKVEIALARGKKKHDKRESDKKKDVEKKLRQRDYT